MIKSKNDYTPLHSKQKIYENGDKTKIEFEVLLVHLVFDMLINFFHLFFSY